MSATDDPRPFCECGYCNATGRPAGAGGHPTQAEVRLPVAAWVVAGANGIGYRGHDCIAVRADHVRQGDTIVQRGRGWAAVGVASSLEASGDLRLAVLERSHGR